MWSFLAAALKRLVQGVVTLGLSELTRHLNKKKEKYK